MKAVWKGSYLLNNNIYYYCCCDGVQRQNECDRHRRQAKRQQQIPSVRQSGLVFRKTIFQYTPQWLLLLTPQWRLLLTPQWSLARIDNSAERAARKTHSRYNQIGSLDHKMADMCFTTASASTFFFYNN